MPVYKDKTRNTWLATFSFYDNRGVRKSFKKRGFKTKREALEWEAEHRGQMTGSLEISFKTFVEDTYLDSMAVRLKPDTMAIKRAIIETHLMPYFGEMRIDRITSKDAFAWQNTMLLYRNPSTGKPYTPSYLKTMQNQLVAIFSFAVRFYGLKENPVRIAGSMGSSRQGEMKFWTLDQFRKFEMAVASEPMWACAFRILFWCGLREGEMLALTPDDFDFEKKTVSITKTYYRLGKEDHVTSPKTIQSVRVVTMPDALSEKVENFVGKSKLKPADRLFHVTKQQVQHAFHQLTDNAGLPKIRVHDLRHSHVSLLIQLGYPPLAIAKRVGHKAIDITYRYSHLYPTVQRDIANTLNDIFTGKKKE